MTAIGRDCLLSLYTPTPPSFDVQQQLRDFGLWTACRLFVSRRNTTACLRRYRGHRGGRPRRPVPRLRPVGNGAFLVNVSRSRRAISCSRPRTLVDVSRSPSADAHPRHLKFGSINICSLTNKLDDLLEDLLVDLLELRKDRGMYALCLVETWHDAESVCMRRLRAGWLPDR